MTGHHGHSVNETKARSLLKAISGRVIEIAVGTLVFGTIISIFFPSIPSPFIAGLGFNLLEETVCFIVTYGTERVWNKVSWGRKVLDKIVIHGSREEEDSTES